MRYPKRISAELFYQCMKCAFYSVSHMHGKCPFCGNPPPKERQVKSGPFEGRKEKNELKEMELTYAEKQEILRKT